MFAQDIHEKLIKMEITEKLTRTGKYPVADDSIRYLKGEWKNWNMIFFRWNGEKRPPKKGEWFLSGAVIEAYYAMNDMDTPYHIAVRVETPPKTIVHGGYLYRFSGPIKQHEEVD